MDKPTFEMNVEYPVIMQWNKHKKGTARYLGFARVTEYGFFEAVFRVTFEDGTWDNMGQMELVFEDSVYGQS